MPFEFNRLVVSDVILVIPKVFGDDRGFFLEFYKQSEFAAGGIPEHFVQDNHSRSVKGVLRGLHYQKDPTSQGKLVHCLGGRIFDVAVDIRKGSHTYGKWVSAELTGENHHILYVPPGFAHGFQVLSDSAEVLYKCTREYSPAEDRGIIWNDPSIAVRWPIDAPILSGKDSLLPLLKDADNNFIIR